MHLLFQWLAKLAEEENVSNASSIPMIWMEPKDHLQVCYFFHVNVKGFSSKQKKKITYASLDSALRPVPHDLSMPASLPLEDDLASLADEVIFVEDSSSAPSDSTGSEYEPEENTHSIFPETMTSSEQNFLGRFLRASSFYKL